MGRRPLTFSAPGATSHSGPRSSPGVAHAPGDSTQREQERPVAVVLPRALAPHELHLKEGHGIDVGIAQGDALLELPVVGEQAWLTRHALHPAQGARVLATDTP